MKILGIDPGTRRIGYGLIEKGKEVGYSFRIIQAVDAVNEEQKNRNQNFQQSSWDSENLKPNQIGRR